MRPPRKLQICCIMVSFVFLCLAPKLSWAGQDQDRKAKSLACYTMGIVYDLRGLNEKAIEEFEKSAQYEDNYAVHLRLGADYARVGKLQEAIDELRLALKFDSSNVQARYLLALIYSTQKEFDKAALEYEAILTSFSEAEPENLEIYGYLGQLYYSQKKYKKAILQFEIMLSIDKDNTDVMFLLGSLYLETGERLKAIDVFFKAVQYDPRDDTCLNSLAYSYAEEGIKLEEARELAERALEISPDNGAYLDSLGWIYYKKGMYQDAVKYLQKADRLLKDPVIYDHLGDVYLGLGNKEEAKKYWNLSLDMLPDQVKVKEKIKFLE